MALVCGCSPYQPGWSCILHGNGDGKNTLATHTTIKSGFHGTWNGKRYMSVCLAFFFCSSTKCQSIPRSLELGITQLKYFFVTLSLCLSGLWQSNVALSLWWRNPVLQCVFKTVKTLFEWQKENAWNPLPYY